MTSTEGFRGPQVCAIVGITYRQLDYWARTDLLRPSITEAKGSGTQRRYSYQDLLELKVIKGLLDAEAYVFQEDEEEVEEEQEQEEVIERFQRFIEDLRPEDFAS